MAAHLVPACQGVSGTLPSPGAAWPGMAPDTDEPFPAPGPDPRRPHPPYRSRRPQERSSVQAVFVPTASAWQALDLRLALGATTPLTASQTEAALIYLAAYHLAGAPAFIATADGAPAFSFPTLASSAPLSGMGAANASASCSNAITLAALPGVEVSEGFVADVFTAAGAAAGSAAVVLKKSDTCQGAQVFALDQVLLPCDLARVLGSGVAPIIRGVDSGAGSVAAPAPGSGGVTVVSSTVSNGAVPAHAVAVWVGSVLLALALAMLSGGGMCWG